MQRVKELCREVLILVHPIMLGVRDNPVRLGVRGNPIRLGVRGRVTVIVITVQDINYWSRLIYIAAVAVWHHRMTRFICVAAGDQ